MTALPAVREALDELEASGREPGGAVCVVRAGHVHEELTSTWSTDRLVMTYSVAKPFAALVVLDAVAAGHLSLETRVVELWPAYGVHDKGATTVRHVLSHQAGLPTFPVAAEKIDYGDHDALADLLAAAAPAHEPGTAVAEHALTYGHLCDALVRRATGRSLADRFGVLAGTAGWDLHLVVGPADLHRVADVVPVDPAWPQVYLDDPRWGPALSRPAGLLDPAVLNSERWRTTSFPAVNLHASARGLATFHADLRDPDGAVAALLGRELLSEYVGPQASGVDLVLDREVTWTLGFQHDPDEIGMGGAGGCSAWTATTEDGYGAAYVTCGLGDHDRDERIWQAVAEDVPS